MSPRYGGEGTETFKEVKWGMGRWLSEYPLLNSKDPSLDPQDQWVWRHLYNPGSEDPETGRFLELIGQLV